MTNGFHINLYVFIIEYDLSQFYEYLINDLQ